MSKEVNSKDRRFIQIRDFNMAVVSSGNAFGANASLKIDGETVGGNKPMKRLFRSLKSEWVQPKGNSS
ncbi:hypothetical protein EEY24_04040 [Shewanella algae]|uniref:Uncharacterized protein n=1 Tax=Shewanella algae TaxID=38313 RepID=A0AAD1K5V2_9GAMM|nr:hypothetical protein EEY24_04040 [Shewanella algae]BCV43349.1 hypothetical protein TUM17379_03670 [Shewanella algae]